LGDIQGHWSEKSKNETADWSPKPVESILFDKGMVLDKW